MQHMTHNASLLHLEVSAVYSVVYPMTCSSERRIIKLPMKVISYIWHHILVCVFSVCWVV